MNQWENAKKQLAEIKELVDLPKEVWQKLEKHDAVYEAELKVGGKKYQAFRAQHNRALGPYKGGIRYHQMRGSRDSDGGREGGNCS
jgi:glutamate dehydrogenase/leucine dehydrogenase